MWAHAQLLEHATMQRCKCLCHRKHHHHQSLLSHTSSHKLQYAQHWQPPQTRQLATACVSADRHGMDGTLLLPVHATTHVHNLCTVEPIICKINDKHAAHATANVTYTCKLLPVAAIHRQHAEDNPTASPAGLYCKKYIITNVVQSICCLFFPARHTVIECTV
jgi:hypothetical protein